MFRNRAHISRRLIRSRWAAVGAAIAVTVGGGGLVGVSAASSAAGGSTFTAISPVRLLDTRSESMVGELDGSGAALRLQVTGDRVPAGAEAVSMNVTVVDGRTSMFGGYVTVYPCDIARPDTSNLNFVHGQTVPNAVTVPLAADGSVCFYVYGRAHLLADVMGFHGDTRITAIEAELTRLRSLSNDDDLTAAVDLSGYATRTETDMMITGTVDSAVSTMSTALDGAVDDLRREIATSIPDPVDLSGYATRTETDTMITGTVDDLRREIAASIPDPVDLSGYATRTETDTMIADAVDGAVGAAISAAVGTAGGAAAPAHGRTVDAVGRVHHQIAAWSDGGHGAAIAVGVDDRVVIAHHDRATGSVLVTRCDDPLCSTALSTTLSSEAGATDIDLAIGGDGMPVVAFASGAADSRLVTAVCGDPSCTTRTTRTHDTGPVSGIASSMTIGVDGLPIIAHIAGGRLAVTRCVNDACSAVAHLLVGTDTSAADPAITVRPDGIPEIAVTSTAGLRLVTCGDRACSTIVADRIVAGPAGGLEPTVAVDTAGRVLIAHRGIDTDGLGDLFLTVCDTPTCAAPTTLHVDGDADGHSVAGSPSMVIGVDGAPRIVHIHRHVDGSRHLRVTTIGSDFSSMSADTHIGAAAVAATLDADGALIGALTVDTGATSTLALHRRVQRSWTVNGWGD